jgi:hypothetical protein
MILCRRTSMSLSSSTIRILPGISPPMLCC